MEAPMAAPACLDDARVEGCQDSIRARIQRKSFDAVALSLELNQHIDV